MYLERLFEKPKDDPSILVALADKVNNAEKTARDIIRDPNLFEKHFNAGYEDQKWWYRSLVFTFDDKKNGSIRDQLYYRLRDAVKQIFTTAGPPAKKGKK